MSWVGWLLVGGGVVLFLVIVLFVWSLCRIAALADREALDLTQEDLACPAGIEPATPSLEGSCSVRLSYGDGASDSTARLPLRSKLCEGVVWPAPPPNMNRGPNCKTCVRPLVYYANLDLFYCITHDCPDFRLVQMEGSAWREMEVTDAQAV